MVDSAPAHQATHVKRVQPVTLTTLPPCEQLHQYGRPASDTAHGLIFAMVKSLALPKSSLERSHGPPRQSLRRKTCVVFYTDQCNHESRTFFFPFLSFRNDTGILSEKPTKRRLLECSNNIQQKRVPLLRISNKPIKLYPSI